MTTPVKKKLLDFLLAGKKVHEIGEILVIIGTIFSCVGILLMLYTAKVEYLPARFIVFSIFSLGLLILVIGFILLFIFDNI